MNCSIEGTFMIINETCRCKRFYSNELCDLYWFNVDWFNYCFYIYLIIVYLLETITLVWSIMIIKYLVNKYKTFNTVANYASVFIFLTSLSRLIITSIDPHGMRNIINNEKLTYFGIYPIYFGLLSFSILLIFWIEITNKKIGKKNEISSFMITLIITIINMTVLIISLLLFILLKPYVIGVYILLIACILMYFFIIIMTPYILCKKVDGVAGDVKNFLKKTNKMYTIGWLIMLFCVVLQIVIGYIVNQIIYSYIILAIINTIVENFICYVILSIIDVKHNFIGLIKLNVYKMNIITEPTDDIKS